MNQGKPFPDEPGGEVAVSHGPLDPIFLPHFRQVLSVISSGRPFTIFLGVWCLLFLANLNVPSWIADSSIDAGWAQLLVYGASHGHQAGVDFIFTYGPLGWLTVEAYSSDFYNQHLLSSIAFSLFASGLLTHAILRINRMFWVIVSVFLCSVYSSTFDYLVTFTAILLLFDSPDRMSIRGNRNSWIPHGFSLALLACLGLVKFSLLILGASGVFIACIHQALSARSLRSASLIGISFCGFLLLFWVAAGQSLANIPAWLRASAEITIGYSEAMIQDKLPGSVVARSTIALTLWVLCMLTPSILRGRMERSYGVFWAAFSCIFALVLWKSGFVRSDPGHLSLFSGCFITCTSVSILCFNQFGNKAYWVVSSILACAILLGGSAGSYLLVNNLPSKLQRNARVLFDPSSHRDSLDRRTKVSQNKIPLDRIKAIVGHDTVDIINGSHQGIVILHDMNFMARPVFQSYSSYTPWLIETNAAFFRGDHAPSYVIVKIDSLDQRFPMLDDGQSLLEIFSRYRPITTEAGYLLLKKDDVSAEPSWPEVLLDQELKWDTRLDLRRFRGKTIAISVNIEYSLFGKLRKAATKAPRVTMTVGSAGASHTFTVHPGMGKTPFLLQPIIMRTCDLVLALHSTGAEVEESVDWIQFSVADKPRLSGFLDSIGITVIEYPITEMAISKLEGFESSDDIQRFYSLASVIELVGKRELGYSCRLQRDERTPYCIFAHAPSKAFVTLPSESEKMCLSYSIGRGAYTGNGATDGVEFAVHATLADGTSKELWTRTLDPRRSSDDCGTQVSCIDLPERAPGSSIRLETNTGPSGAWDWSQWCGIEAFDEEGNSLPLDPKPSN